MPVNNDVLQPVDMTEPMRKLMEGVGRLTEGLQQSIGHSVGAVSNGFGEIRYFVTLCSHGVKDEGAVPFYYKTPDEAVDAYLETFAKNLLQEPVVYWRETPSIQSMPDGYYVYSRLLQGPEGLYDFVKEKNLDTQGATNYKEQAEPSIEYLHPGWRTARKGPNPANTSGFRATGHRVLLLPDEVEKTTASGIILAQKTVNAEEQIAVVCTVLEIGPDAWDNKSTDYCEVGDRVLIGQYVGKFHTSPIDGKRYRFVQDLDIISPLPQEPK